MARGTRTLPILLTMAGTAMAAEPLGYRERIGLRLDREQVLDAKLDTGAEGSSLHAEQLQRFVRDGRDWVRFRLPGTRQMVERPVLREVRVRRSGEGERRPKIAATLCLGGREFPAELSLTDRSGFEGALLIGRDLLARLGPVDASRQYLHSPECPP